VRVYKINGKYAIYIPQNVVEKLKINEGDEVEFLPINNNNNAFLFTTMKKITNEFLKGNDSKNEEIELLKKLNEIKFKDRIVNTTNNMLNENEKKLLNSLIKKGYVKIFEDSDGIKRYSIDNKIFERYLSKKNDQKQSATFNEQKQQKNEENPLIKTLDEKGYLVLATEEEAGAISKLLEEDIKMGLVTGTRGFNKKYYIAKRSFLDDYIPKVMNILRERGVASIKEISNEINLDEDGTRTLLYIMAINGDIIEKKRDFFAIA